ncbi:unnamed protein product, partial [Rotaria sordida]
ISIEKFKKNKLTIEYARTCANYLLSKTIDGQSLYIFLNFSHHFDLITSARSSPPHQTFFSTSSTYKRLASSTSSKLGDQYQRAHELLSDFEYILLQINGDFLVKEETFRSETPICVHVEDLPIEFTYTRILTTTTRRKIEALHEIIQQIEQELAHLLVDYLNNDPVVVDKNDIKIN